LVAWEWPLLAIMLCLSLPLWLAVWPWQNKSALPDSALS
jgi:LPLT family lysophospholipid transporter-like MFS transporter